MTTELTPAKVRLTDGLGAGAEARETCPACGDHAAYRVQRLECRSCGCTFGCDWDRAPCSPIADLLLQYANERSDFSGPKGYEFALMLARSFAERGPDSQMRCVVHTLLARLEAPNEKGNRPA